jgi:hypothetical protein
MVAAMLISNSWLKARGQFLFRGSFSNEVDASGVPEFSGRFAGVYRRDRSGDQF